MFSLYFHVLLFVPKYSSGNRKGYSSLLHLAHSCATGVIIYGSCPCPCLDIKLETLNFLLSLSCGVYSLYR